jgi:hypothetical protein
VLSDVTRASIQVARGKIALVSNGISRATLVDLFNELAWKGLVRSETSGALGEGSSPELRSWFGKDTLSQLRFIWGLIETFVGAEREALELLFSDTLFRAARPGFATKSGAARRRHHWGWIADNVRPLHPPEHDVVEMFRAALAAVEKTEPLANTPDVTVTREDARTLSHSDETIDLIVTSPPYLGVIDYALANRLTYLWMNWPLEEDRMAELGPRRRRTSLRARDEYMAGMHDSLREFFRVLRRRGHLAMVIGTSRRHPQAARAVIDMATGLFESVWGPVVRRPSRRRVAERAAREATELVCVLQKR